MRQCLAGSTCSLWTVPKLKVVNVPLEEKRKIDNIGSQVMVI